MGTDPLAVYKHESKSKKYIDNTIRASFKQLEPSLTYFLGELDLKNKKILDLGCAAGDMFNALTEKFISLEYVGIDPDEKCINHAKQQYPKATFEAIDLMKNTYPDSSFDVVMLWNWFYMAPNWKEILREACRLSRQYVLFDNKLRLEGTTVIDIDCSFQYYHESREKNHYIVHNLYELIAFFHVDYLNLKKASVYAYPYPGKTSAFLPLPLSHTFIGSVCLERYSNEESESVRRVGTSIEAAHNQFLALEIDVPGFEQ